MNRNLKDMGEQAIWDYGKNISGKLDKAWGASLLKSNWKDDMARKA